MQVTGGELGTEWHKERPGALNSACLNRLSMTTILDDYREVEGFGEWRFPAFSFAPLPCSHNGCQCLLDNIPCGRQCLLDNIPRWQRCLLNNIPQFFGMPTTHCAFCHGHVFITIGPPSAASLESSHTFFLFLLCPLIKRNCSLDRSIVSIPPSSYRSS